MREIFFEVANEVIKANRAPNFSSIHEGLAMIRDKYINLEHDIFDIEHEHLSFFRDMCEEFEIRTFDSDSPTEPASMRDNALQLAVMAIKMIRFIDKQPRKEPKRLLRFEQHEQQGAFLE